MLVPAKVQDLTWYWPKMLTVIEGPILKYTKSSVAIHWAFAEFCSRCEKQKLNEVSAGLFFKKKRIAVGVCSIMFGCKLVCFFLFFFKTACCMQVLKIVCDPVFKCE